MRTSWLMAMGLLAMVPLAAGAQQAPVTGPSGLELAGFEDYVRPAGRMDGGVLRITLEARPAEWQPWGPEGPGIVAHAFSADGEPPRVPAPLIRARAGTPVHVKVRNTFDHPLVVRALQDSFPPQTRPGRSVADSIVVEPHGAGEVRFTPRIPGTYVYTATVVAPRGAVPRPIPGADEANRPFVGILIVDPPEGPLPAERFFILNHWGERSIPASFLPATRFFVNGRSWPHTERLEYQQGDTVRWRIINFTGRPHPMHLHGFYFSIDARGNLRREQVYPLEERRMAVTELLEPAHSMRIAWVPAEPGNWIFHCHFMRHMSRLQTAPLHGPAATHEHDEPAGADLMGGLVMGINVRPGPGYVRSADGPRRRLPLHIGLRPGVFGEQPGYGFVLQEGSTAPASDSIRFPGSLLLLKRGEPTEIVVHNRADVPLGVHWHGLELESWADGVPGWSGMPGSAIPAIQPGDSLAVRMTPPRAGTFMYHVHSEPGHQLAQGLYGPFLVVEPGEEYDPERDRIFLLGSLGTGEDPPAAVNGQVEPGPIDFRAGETYRLRFMHISPDDDKRVSLLAGDRPVEWRHAAKDGADLPAREVREVPAELRINVGETYDFLWTPESAGDFTLRIETTFDRGAPVFPRNAPPPQVQAIPVRVR
jgi:FtsP/CotA-like multicopper oxidase with cupredoxin domain